MKEGRRARWKIATSDSSSQGFAVVWVGLFAYIIYVSRREQALRREVADLRQELAEREERGGR